MKQFLTNTVWAFKSSRKVPPPLRSRRRAPLAVEALEDRLVPSTFWVTNTLDSGPGSLRQAILGANAHPGRDAINFAIPGAGVHTIAPRSALPAITDPVVINGTTQPGYAGAPLVQLDGTAAGSASAAGPGADGLHISAGSSTVRVTMGAGANGSPGGSGARVTVSGLGQVNSKPRGGR